MVVLPADDLWYRSNQQFYSSQHPWWLEGFSFLLCLSRGPGSTRTMTAGWCISQTNNTICKTYQQFPWGNFFGSWFAELSFEIDLDFFQCKDVWCWINVPDKVVRWTTLGIDSSSLCVCCSALLKDLRRKKIWICLLSSCSQQRKPIASP